MQPNSDHVGEYAVMLPCSPENFGSFIGSLLGKPQTIDRVVRGEYGITKDNLVNLYHLVDQRVHMQNQATLMQFVVKVIYADSSSVQLSSLGDFIAYNEVHPKVSNSVNLSWIYLVQFPKKQAPEKQTIEVTIGDTEERRYMSSGALPRARITVSHTERSWGMDIEALLAGHLANYFRHPTGPRRLSLQFRRYTSIFTSVLLFLVCVFGVWHAMTSLATAQMEAANKLVTSSANGAQQLAERLDFLVQLIASGIWSRFAMGSVWFLFVALIVSIFVGFAIESVLFYRYREFLLLTDASRIARDDFLLRERNEALIAIASILGSLVAGVVSNLLYTKLFAPG